MTNTTDTITESSHISYPYGYGMLDTMFSNLAHKFEMELRHKGIEVPKEAIECIEELVDSARKRARYQAQVEFATYGS